MVLLAKVNEELRGIGLVEVIWKAVLEVVNHRTGVTVNFHDELHGFQAGRRTGTAGIQSAPEDYVNEVEGPLQGITQPPEGL